MEKIGFQFEKEQKPHLQNRKENELKFTHPTLIKRLTEDGYKVKAKKFYIKPLSNEPDCEIGFVTGKTSPLHNLDKFIKPNSTDTFVNAKNNLKIEAKDKAKIYIFNSPAIEIMAFEDTASIFKRESMKLLEKI